MFTIDQVTAVQAVFRMAGFDKQLRITEMQRPDEITFAFAPETIFPLRQRAGQDLEHVIQQILRLHVRIIPEGEPWSSVRPFDLSLITSADVRSQDAPTHGPANNDTASSLLSLDESFRSAYFMIDGYVSLETHPDDGLILLRQYMLSDPARWSDWTDSVRKALDDPTAASEYLHDWRFRFDPPEDFEGP